MNKQPKITDATREAFISAFFQLAGLKNIYSISIREVTNLAGYNRTTFYRYFTDIFALIEYVEDQFIEETLEILVPRIQVNMIDEGFFQLMLNHFYTNSERLGVLLCDQNKAAFIRRIEERVFESMPANNSWNNRVIMDIYFNGIFSAIATQIQHPERWLMRNCWKLFVHYL